MERAESVDLRSLWLDAVDRLSAVVSILRPYVRTETLLANKSRLQWIMNNINTVLSDLSQLDSAFKSIAQQVSGMSVDGLRVNNVRKSDTIASLMAYINSARSILQTDVTRARTILQGVLPPLRSLTRAYVVTADVTYTQGGQSATVVDVGFTVNSRGLVMYLVVRDKCVKNIVLSPNVVVALSEDVMRGTSGKVGLQQVKVKRVNSAVLYYYDINSVEGLVEALRITIADINRLAMNNILALCQHLFSGRRK